MSHSYDCYVSLTMAIGKLVKTAMMFLGNFWNSWRVPVEPTGSWWPFRVIEDPCCEKLFFFESNHRNNRGLITSKWEGENKTGRFDHQSWTCVFSMAPCAKFFDDTIDWRSLNIPVFIPNPPLDWLSNTSLLLSHGNSSVHLKGHEAKLFFTWCRSLCHLNLWSNLLLTHDSMTM